MKLGWPALERAVRRRVKPELRHSKLLWKEYRRRRQRWTFPRVALGLYGILGLFWLPAFLLFQLPGGRSATPLLLALALYLSGTVFLRVGSWRSFLYESHDLAFFLHHPVSDKEFFWYEWRGFLFRSLWPLYIAVLVYAFVAWRSGWGWDAWPAVLGAGFLQWLLMLGLCLVVLLYWPGAPSIVGLVLNLSALVVVIAAPRSVEGAGDAVLLLPAGWINRVFRVFTAQPDTLLGVFGIPAVGLGVAVLGLVWLAHRRYPTHELQLPSLESFESEAERIPIAHEAAQPLALPLDADATRTRDHFLATRMEESVRSGDSLDAPDWSAAGWMERLVASWFSARERIVAEFLLAEALGWWTTRWRKAVFVGSAGILMVLLAPFLSMWVLSLALLVSASMAVPVLGGSWRGLALAHRSPMASLYCAGYPVGYWEVSRVLFKANLVRILAWLPVAFAYGAALAWQVGLTPLYGIGVAVAGGFFLLLGQPYFVVGQHSKGTNDSRQSKLPNLVFMLAALGSVLSFFFLVIFFFFLEGRVWTGLGLVALSMASWAFYGFLLNRCRIDLVREWSAHE